MSVTLIASAIVKDKDQLAAYRAEAGAALAKHGGSIVQAGPVVETIEGEASTQTVAILSFPEVENAHAWINDPELAPVHALRNAGVQSQIVMLG